MSPNEASRRRAPTSSVTASFRDALREEGEGNTATLGSWLKDKIAQSVAGKCVDAVMQRFTPSPPAQTPLEQADSEFWRSARDLPNPREGAHGIYKYSSNVKEKFFKMLGMVPEFSSP